MSLPVLATDTSGLASRGRVLLALSNNPSSSTGARFHRASPAAMGAHSTGNAKHLAGWTPRPARPRCRPARSASCSPQHPLWGRRERMRFFPQGGRGGTVGPLCPVAFPGGKGNSQRELALRDRGPSPWPPGFWGFGHHTGGSGPTEGPRPRGAGTCPRRCYSPAAGGRSSPPPPNPVPAQAPLSRRGERGGVGRKGRGRSHLGAAIGSTQPGGAGRPRAPAKAFRAGTGAARRSGRRRRLALPSSPLPPLRERGLGLGLGGGRVRSRSAMEPRTGNTLFPPLPPPPAR